MMVRTSSYWLLHHRWMLMAGAVLLLAGCGDSQTGTFNGAASEKLAAEKGLAPGSKTTLKAAPPPVASGRTGKAPKPPGVATPNPN
jgi:hypothetical protein